MTTTAEYAKPYGLRKMIDAYDDLMASPLTLIAENPHMNMAGVLTRIARHDERCWKGGNGMLRLAFDSLAMIESGAPAMEAERQKGLVG